MRNKMGSCRQQYILTQRKQTNTQINHNNNNNNNSSSSQKKTARIWKLASCVSLALYV